MKAKSLTGWIIVFLILGFMVYLNYSYKNENILVTNLNFYSKTPSSVRCKDFYNQASAQKFYDSSKNNNQYSKLDGDHDGKVCESLP
ncbi:MAG TPA: excalibur calcium-binding domain-containing protein [Patescibacteria group bacterium]|nr:excalibur calcium-binding domain-containing protein [Patescibacteria group bacterium]